MTRRHLLWGGLALPAVLAAQGCGYLLYPQRNGRRGGPVDVPVLIIDLLWLIPGVIPGAVCLIVDFMTGCIYGGPEDRPRDWRAELPVAATATVLVDDEVVATGQVQPDRKLPMQWLWGVSADVLRARGRLVVTGPDGARAEAALRDLV
jgi:hypothetical protein